MELHVVDISPCIYAGSFNRHSFIAGDIISTVNGYRERIIPTGGASMLFNILGQYMGRGTVVFVADRNPTVKKDMYPNYKGSRTHPENVSVGKEVAEYILKDCGFNIFCADGYEADDVIYTITKQNEFKYDHVYVHTADSDLYLLVDDRVSILPTSSQAKTVTMENYEYTCKSGWTIPYNSVVARKFIEGDRSKDLAPLSKKERQFMEHALYRPQCLRLLGSPDCVKYILKNYPQYHERITLFYPLAVPVSFSLEQQVDTRRVQEWAYEIGNRKVPQRRGDLSRQISEMMEMALYIEEY